LLSPTGQGLVKLAQSPTPTTCSPGKAAEFVTSYAQRQPAANVDIMRWIPAANRYVDDLGGSSERPNCDGKVRITWPEAGMY